MCIRDSLFLCLLCCHLFLHLLLIVGGVHLVRGCLLYTSSQIKVIKRLFDTSEHIIVATDAGREGELIFRYLYHYKMCIRDRPSPYSSPAIVWWAATIR